MPDKAPVQTELDLLTALERGEVITQMSLSRRVAVSVGLINALLKRAVHKGFVKARAAPYKRYAYYLTPKGFAEKSRLVAEYLEVSLDFFRRARSEYSELFQRLHALGWRRLALVGSGELAEIALLAAHGMDVEIVAIVDEQTNSPALLGHRVARSFADLDGVDAVVITDSRQPQAAYDRARAHVDDARIAAPRLLRVTRRVTTTAETGSDHELACG